MPLAGLAAAAALLAGCGGAEEDPAEAPTSAAVEQSDSGGTTTSTDEQDADETPTEGENLFTGTWGFGHDEKTLDAAQLAALLEEEAEARGPA